MNLSSSEILEGYIRRSGLNLQLIPEDFQTLTGYQKNVIQSSLAKAKENHFHNDHIENLFTYQVPQTVNGVCSVNHGLEPYDLRKHLDQSEIEISNQFVLNELVDYIQKSHDLGWLGIYKRITTSSGEILLKLAYRGLESRPEFPLSNPNFISNNKTVGLTGQAILIQDIDDFLENGGEWYECDPNVKSEACLPVFDSKSGQVLGIIDAEDSRKNFFSEEKMSELVALCLNLGFFWSIGE